MPDWFRSLATHPKSPMKMKLAVLLLTGFLAATNFVHAQDDTNQIARLKEAVQLVKNLKYQQGDIDLRGGLAKLSVPKEFNFLGPDDAETVLVKLWGNPPSEVKPLGLLIPAGMTPLSTNCWVVTIAYSEDGFVKDDDASKINYDDLLKKMQAGIAENNKVRTRGRNMVIRPSRSLAGRHRRIMMPPRTSFIGRNS